MIRAGLIEEHEATGPQGQSFKVLTATERGRVVRVRIDAELKATVATARRRPQPAMPCTAAADPRPGRSPARSRAKATEGSAQNRANLYAKPFASHETVWPLPGDTDPPGEPSQAGTGS